MTEARSAIVGSELEVIEGAQGWLFLKRFNRIDFLAQAQDLAGWNQATFSRQYAKYLSRAERLQRKNIPFFILFAPESAGIYDEYLPEGYRVEFPTASERLASALLQAGVQAISPSHALRAAKGDRDVYFRTDSHWSYSGAFIAYQLLMEKIKPLLPIRPVEAANIKFAANMGYGDLSVHVKPERQALLETVQVTEGEVEEVFTTYDQRDQPVSVSRCATGVGRALIFRDSFSHHLKPFLDRTFAETIMIAPSPAMPDDAIEYFKPDVVVLEVAERSLFQVEPSFNDWDARTFAQSHLENHLNPAGGKRQVAAVSAINRHDCLEAVGQASTALILEKEHGRAHNLAWAFFSAGHHKLCNQICETALKDDPSNCFLHYLNAHSLSAMGKTQAAADCLDRAIEMRPNNALYRYNKGLWAQMLGQLDHAAASLELSLKGEPTHEHTWLTLIEAYRALGSEDAARQAVERAQRVFGEAWAPPAA